MANLAFIFGVRWNALVKAVEFVNNYGLHWDTVETVIWFVKTFVLA